MIKLPARQDGQWTVTYSSDKLPDLSATKNLSFDKEGYLRLSKPVTSYFSEVDSADFGLPLYWGIIGTGIYYTLTDEQQFELTMGAGKMNTVVTTALNAPANTDGNGSRAGAAIFNNAITYATHEDIYTHPLGAFTNDWTDRNLSASLSTNKHPLCNFVFGNSLAVGNGNTVKLISTSYAVTATLTIPAEYEVTGIAYSNSFLGITCHDKLNHGNGKFYVWDGIGTAANYAYDIGASTCTSPVAYRGSFAFLNGTGQLLYWTPQRLETLGALPSYFTTAQFFIGAINVNRNESIHVDGDVLYLNIDSALIGRTSDNESYISNQPGGIWCYDPSVGLYHRHATTATKMSAQTIATTSVDTTTDVITVTTAYETGTPVRYSDADSTTLEGLTNGQVYFAIYVSATTIKLAETYTEAVAGIAIDLTGTGNSAQTLQFYPKSDFGQSYNIGQQGGVQLIEDTTLDGIYTQGLFFGADCSSTTTTEYHAAGFTLKDTENRGYFTTAKIQSNQLQDHWQKVHLKHKALSSDLDKIVIKYRTKNDGPLVKISDNTTDGLVTWSDSDTFTSTDPQFANVIVGDEVEIIQGTGSGYLAHITSISEDGGTYTVNLDESIKNLTAATTGRVVVSRWTKLTTITNANPTNSDGYSEITVGVKSKTIQFKVELRGEDIEIEELLVANGNSKPV